MEQPSLKVHWSDCQVDEERIQSYRSSLLMSQARLGSGEEAFTGWVHLPFQYDREEWARIETAARKIQQQCEAFVVIGIGGSYLGARAAIEMLKPKGPYPDVYFAGYNISGTYHAELLDELKDKELCVCVISKSGTTTEPSIAFGLFKDLLIRKYGKEEANRRIYAITDASKGILREEATEEGYQSFVVPDDIGGRYSVLTAVGLLPIAVAGIDIDGMMEGAKAEASRVQEGLIDDASRLAVVRNELFNRGKVIEVYEYYEPKLQYFTEWMKQLFGESEGKEGKGIFPAALQFSADLHSMGQFLQEGNPIFFETVLHVAEPERDLTVPESAGGMLAGMNMNRVNLAAVEGVMAAHRSAGIPMLRIDLPALTPYYFGRMVYFFERTCALSGYLAGVDPFNQPGVESYKAEMRKALQR